MAFLKISGVKFNPFAKFFKESEGLTLDAFYCYKVQNMSMLYIAIFRNISYYLATKPRVTICMENTMSIVQSVRMIQSFYNFIYGTFYGKMGLVDLYIKNRYISRNINAIGFLFLTQHTTPLLHVTIHFGVILMWSTNVTRSNTP